MLIIFTRCEDGVHYEDYEELLPHSVLHQHKASEDTPSYAATSSKTGTIASTSSLGGGINEPSKRVRVKRSKQTVSDTKASTSMNHSVVSIKAGAGVIPLPLM